MESTAKEGEKQQRLGTPIKSPEQEEIEIRKMKAKGKLFGKSAATVKSSDSRTGMNKDGTAKEGTEQSGANVTSDIATALAPRSDNIETAQSGATTTSGTTHTATTASATSVDPSTGQSTGQSSGMSSGTTRSGTEDAASGITTRTSGSSKTRGGQSATLTTSASSATTDGLVGNFLIKLKKPAEKVTIHQNSNSASGLVTNTATSPT
ncbi:hypothetical protein Y032_0064g3559 [Ancylostoma ceylanicum]|uniref:Uncharacterized protein n=1 Tax=Ancylostoma ceylanicum TaxID=53326 RepID=A0A016U0I8_9BILA|nr:hypothetical protein Y032_0064g3559 [Ancylostoma ceylanicum]